MSPEELEALNYKYPTCSPYATPLGRRSGRPADGPVEQIRADRKVSPPRSCHTKATSDYFALWITTWTTPILVLTSASSRSPIREHVAVDKW
jgi:hypothetical protein